MTCRFGDLVVGQVYEMTFEAPCQICGKHLTAAGKWVYKGHRQSSVHWGDQFKITVPYRHICGESLTMITVACGDSMAEGLFSMVGEEVEKNGYER